MGRPLSITKSKTTSSNKLSRLITVGASAGGLEALKTFFENLPKHDQNSYVVIQHLSPDYKSMMAELLAKSTNLTIKEITDKEKILPGHIYLIPSGSNVLLEKGLLRLKGKPKNSKLNLPIDIFLNSLAHFKNGQTIAVILSGTGSDGTRGIAAIKANNGLVIAQHPDDAQFDGMPKSAINTGLVDYILPVDEMGGEIENIITTTAAFSHIQNDIEYDEQILEKILQLVDAHTGLDFKEYKPATLVRRLERRLKACKCSSLNHYFLLLQAKPEEIEILSTEFLIGVTKFFRDNQVWEVLREEVIPELVKNAENGATLKIWDVACSTGEEAYSLAISLNEEIEKQKKKLDIKIFATDISQKHLDIGSQGIYSESIMADVDERLLKKYFIGKSQGHLLAEGIRRMVVFSKHNVVKNPPFNNMDMVFCRNLLIYFLPGIQKKTLDVLHYSLKEGGVLVLGTSESASSHYDSFTDINRKWKIYRNSNPRKRLNHKNLKSRIAPTYNPVPALPKKAAKTKLKKAQEKFYTEFNEAILDQFGGSSVIVDSDFNILQAIGEFRKYANLPVTGFSTNLLDMLDSDLKHVVQSSVKKATKQNKTILYEGAVYNQEFISKSLDLIVKPFSSENLAGERNYILTFIEKELDFSELEIVEKITITSHAKDYIADLEEEIARIKEELQAALEDTETSNEELQASNEELLASNEELQSTNEELQSVNEEMNTVNAENVQKMEELAALNADMNNLLESTNIGTIFLDTELRIRKFTPAIKEHFSFLNSDVGRPIKHFTGSIGRSNLLGRCKRVLTSGKALERIIYSKDKVHYLRRISAYYNPNNEIKGVVITFIDIQSLQVAKEKLEESEKRFKSFYEEDPVMHFSVDPKTVTIIQCNKEAVEKLEYNSMEDILGMPFFELYEDESQLKALKLNKLFKEKGELVNVAQEMVTRNGKIIPIIMNSTVELDSDGNGVANRFTCVDISELQKAQEDLKMQKADLERANCDLEQFVSICSHDLQEPLATIKFGSDILGKIYAEKLDAKGKEYISYIDAASDRLAAQIKALLEHSRIGRNTQKTMVNTKELVEIVKYDLGKRIRDTQAKVHIGSLPKIKVYEVELRLLFQNLLSNALKYIDKNRTPEIRVSAYPEGKYWVFSVMDNGIGMTQEDQENIFTIFNRVPTEEKYEGTGVGLAHVEKIVNLHEGAIWVDSQPGVGSTFYIKIKTAK